MASGISCFFLRQNWVQNFHEASKVPLYGILGISFAFTLTYAFTEMINLCPWDKCCGATCRENPIFGTSKQIFLLFACSLVLGACFGLMFGLIDAEDDKTLQRLFVNIYYAIPLGLIPGMLFGVGNEMFRQRGTQHPKAPETHREIDSLL
eukprot:TRINITY_DN4840_c0_g2_i3.p1 TRINITY_DN4840_c0_g2~~TRINITY_DN4840_c0_g2_i3.p1  ORF type:complete len:150 (-),score=23.76 TRINITY_DN4840_c0_g2_i3:391-840(-)